MKSQSSPGKAEPDNIEAQRARLISGGKLHWIHGIVISLSLLVTFGTWYLVKQQSDEHVSAQFQREVSNVVEFVVERMETYEDGLWGGVGAIQAQGGDISIGSWLDFASALDLHSKYPGIDGIGVVHRVLPGEMNAYLEQQLRSRPNYKIHPQHNEKEFLPVTYIEPVAANREDVGLDMAHELNRYSAAKKARDTGVAQLTGPIILVRDAKKTPTFLLFAPFYKNGTYDTTAERRAQFSGIVYAPFNVKHLMESALPQNDRQVTIRLRDGTESLYNEHVGTEPNFDPKPIFKESKDILLYGRTWSFDIWSGNSFRKATADDQPFIIFSGGIAINILLLTLFILLSQANKRAVRFADAASLDLQKRQTDLERANRELEQFAYVASHDLKAPLRGIATIVEFLEEDLGEKLDDRSHSHMNLMKNRVERMEGLLDGLLAYARAGRSPVTEERVVVGDLIREISESVESKDFAINTVGTLPALSTGRAPLQQVLQNLIENAIKHHDQARGWVQIRARDLGPMFEFTVTDNGPGIPDRYQDKVFEMFQTLKPRDEVEGSGMGLALVLRNVKVVGGTITLEPAGERGATFRFTWPKKWPQGEQFHGENYVR